MGKICVFYSGQGNYFQIKEIKKGGVNRKVIKIYGIFYII